MASRKKKQLSVKRRVWADAYLANGFNGKEAARTAKYSEKRLKESASDNLRDPLVKAYLDERMKTMQMTADEALARLAEHGRGNVSSFIGLGQDEIKTHPAAWLIKKYKFKTRRIASGVIEEFNEIEIHDPQAALNSILKQHQLASGLPTEIVAIAPTITKLVEMLAAAGQDANTVFERMMNKIAQDANAGH